MWISLFALISMSPVASAAEFPPLRTVTMELHRYMGQWYEVARLANRFQKHCFSGTLIRYSLRPDGKFDLYNECRDAEGKVHSSTAVGRKAEPDGPDSKLKVTFLWPFAADYWVIDVDPEYRWALAGQPSRDYLWILSREPRIDDSLYARLVDTAKTSGFDVKRLIRTMH